MPGAPKTSLLKMADGGLMSSVSDWATRLVGNSPQAMALRGRSADVDPAPAPAAPVPAPPAPSMGGTVTADNPAGIRFADGGGLRGQTYTKGSLSGGRVVGKGGPVSDQVPAKYSPGEYVLPTDTAQAIGYDKLDAVKDATHTPAAVQRSGLRMANGGAYDPTLNPPGAANVNPQPNPQGVPSAGPANAGGASGGWADNTPLPGGGGIPGNQGGASGSWDAKPLSYTQGLRQGLPDTSAVASGTADDVGSSLAGGHYAGAAVQALRGGLAMVPAALNDTVGAAVRSLAPTAKDVVSAATGDPYSAPAAAPPSLRAPAPAAASVTSVAPAPNAPGANQAGYDADNAAYSKSVQAPQTAAPAQPAADPAADAASYQTQLAKNNAAADDLQATRLRLQPQLDAQSSVLSSPGGATVGTSAADDASAHNASFDADEAKYQAKNALDHNPGLRGVAMANSIMGAQTATAGQQAQKDIASLNNQAANTRAVLENNTTLRGQTMNQQTNERGQDMTLAGHRMSNQVAYAQAMRDQFNKDRSYQMDVQKFGVDQANKNMAERQTAQKNLQDQIVGMIPPGPDGKPDAAGSAQYMTAINADLASKQQVLTQRAAAGDKQAQAALDDFNQHGVGTLDPAYIRSIVNGVKAKGLVDQYATSPLNPVGGTGVVSDAPVTSLRKTSNGFLGLGGEYTATHADGSPAGTIPARAVEGDGSFIGGKRRNDLRSLIHQ